MASIFAPLRVGLELFCIRRGKPVEEIFVHASLICLPPPLSQKVGVNRAKVEKEVHASVYGRLPGQ